MAAEVMVGHMVSRLQARSSSYESLTQKHAMTIEESEFTLKNSMKSLSKRWSSQQKAEIEHKRRGKRIHTLKQRLNKQKMTRLRMLMYVGVQEIIKRKFERIMKDVVGVFGTVEPSEVIEKMENAKVRGETLQQNLDFLIKQIATLKTTNQSLRLTRTSLKQSDRPSKSDLMHLNGTKVRSLEHQLTLQRSKLSQLDQMAANIEATLRSLLLKVWESDDLLIFSGYNSGSVGGVSIQQLFLLYEKSVSFACESSVQKRAHQHPKSKKIQLDKVMPKRTTQSGCVSPISYTSDMMWPLPALFPQLAEGDDNAVNDFLAEVKSARADYKREKAKFVNKESRHKHVKTALTERTKTAYDKQVEFAKELRAVDSARRELSSIARTTRVDSLSSLEVRPAHNSWSFVTTATRKSNADTRVSELSSTGGRLQKQSLH